MEIKEQLRIAEQIAREVHKGQRRTIGRREEYIEHPKRVASHFSTEESKIVAWLHDVLEDSNMNSIDLIKKGISAELVNEIEILTKPQDHNYCDYILRIKRSKSIRSISIKIADIKDNLEKLDKGSLRDKYLLALYILEEFGDKEK